VSDELSKDRTNLCVFTFADGRHCTMPQSAGDMGLCYYHARKFADKKLRDVAAERISKLLETNITTACDLNAVFNAAFAAAAQGVLKPKLASTLGYLGNLMLQSQQLAKQEYLDTFNHSWSRIVKKAPAFALAHPAPENSATVLPRQKSPSVPALPARVASSDSHNHTPDVSDPDAVLAQLRCLANR
jgi:hypothetical protein